MLHSWWTTLNLKNPTSQSNLLSLSSQTKEKPQLPSQKVDLIQSPLITANVAAVVSKFTTLFPGSKDAVSVSHLRQDSSGSSYSHSSSWSFNSFCWYWCRRTSTSVDGTFSSSSLHYHQPLYRWLSSFTIWLMTQKRLDQEFNKGSCSSASQSSLWELSLLSTLPESTSLIWFSMGMAKSTEMAKKHTTPQRLKKNMFMNKLSQSWLSEASTCSDLRVPRSMLTHMMLPSERNEYRRYWQWLFKNPNR